ncbi:MAG TPA: dTDP-4-dehydrorhamnose 3,5-epimerase, partial [Myxococcota bacterium]
GIKLITPKVFADDRGFFLEPWNAARLKSLGLETDFVQDNHSRSTRGTIRGLHLQLPSGAVPGQAKLLRCARGAILDVVVDVRPWSPTFKQHLTVQLDDDKHQQLFIPVGFAHGFCVLSDVADVCYKVTSLYDPATETGFRYDDPAVGIQWPVSGAAAVVSQRDKTAPTLDELTPRLRGLSR